MKIELNEFNIETFIENDKYCEFVGEMSKDTEISKYVPGMLEIELKETKDLEKFEGGHSYIISTSKNLIGFIEIWSALKMCNLSYGLHEKYRNLGYGKKMLIEVSDYLLNHYQKINLYIDEKNIPSNKCAINAGYRLVNKVGVAVNVYERKK